MVLPVFGRKDAGIGKPVQHHQSAAGPERFSKVVEHHVRIGKFVTRMRAFCGGPPRAVSR
jgi:hypothetical protein